MSWWETASVEQRLAQIDGGIECGMTAREVAICSGLSQDSARAVGVFARRHDRNFPHENLGRGAANLAERKIRRRVYFQGEPEINLAPAVSSRVLDDDFEELAL